MGTKNSGVSGHIRGWDLGIRVSCAVNEKGVDVCDVYRTGGSNHRTSDKLIATVTADGAEDWIISLGEFLKK